MRVPPADAFARIKGDRCSHVALLRDIAARLEAIGGPEAAEALDALAASSEAHIATVEATIALVEALEASAPIH